MKFTLYIKDKEIKGIAFDYKNTRHCTGDIRTLVYNQEITVVTSKLTDCSNKSIFNLEDILKECVVECGGYEVKEIDIEPQDIYETDISGYTYFILKDEKIS